MKTIKEYEINLPDYSLSYLINADSSGLSEEEVKTIDNYMRFYYNLAKFDNASVIISPEEESFFTWNPAFGLACDCTKATILIVK